MNKDEKTTLDTEKLSDKQLDDATGGMYIKTHGGYICRHCGQPVLNRNRVEHNLSCPGQKNDD